ncbi:hypothetical protein E2C01_062888 [Portunus trituberculatus]|uniref:Uncharacterized protein n=1 Tax=Portunus trituberculatus TaxID=210409 RepID=A0A5B7HJC1_PORTR|nr:hypothetical protein [Portunus trituberculatus]
MYCHRAVGKHDYICIVFHCSLNLSTVPLPVQAWEEVCAELGVVPLWQSASDVSHRTLIIRLADHLELSSRTHRMRAARAILYIVQVSGLV